MCICINITRLSDIRELCNPMVNCLTGSSKNI